MDKGIGKEKRNIGDFFSSARENLKILEDEVDLNVQKEYFNLLKELSATPQKCKQLSAQYMEKINNLFDDSVDPETRKKMLVVLANINDVSVYRAIESLSKTDTPLKKWAVVALQQSRMTIESALIDDPGIFISTGLGGQNGLLRYFCVFFYNGQKTLEKFQQQIVYEETSAKLKQWSGTIEQNTFSEHYCTFLLLLPIHADLHSLFQEIIDECNLYGNFLHENMLVTNIKKLSEEEIEQISLKEEKQQLPPDQNLIRN